MIEHTDTTILGTTTLKNKLGITAPNQLAAAEADLTARRRTELHNAPLRGGFDSVHLQDIHRYIYQDLYDWAGELRQVDLDNRPGAEVQASLDTILDRLRRENHLKGRSSEDWVRSASAYVYDLGVLQPFLAGNDVALREFADSLARKNNLTLQWDSSPETAVSEAISRLHQAEQSANLRRIVMLAMDSDRHASGPRPGNTIDRSIDRFLSARNPVL